MKKMAIFFPHKLFGGCTHGPIQAGLHFKTEMQCAEQARLLGDRGIITTFIAKCVIF